MRAKSLKVVVLLAIGESARVTVGQTLPADTIALTGTDGPFGPRLGPGVQFQSFGMPQVDGTGTAGFVANIGGVGVEAASNQGVWLGTPGTVAMFARSGSQPPGAATYELFKTFDEIVVNGGRIAVRATFGSSAPTSYKGIWTGIPGSVVLVARSGQFPASGFALSSTYPSPAMNASGRIACTGDSPGGQRNVWTGFPGAMAAATTYGSPVPGLPGVTFGFAGGQAISDNHTLAFVGTINGTGITTDNNVVLWCGRSGQVQMAARKGTTLPGLEEGVTLLSIENGISVNDSASVAFLARLAGSGITSANEYAIYAGQAGGIHLVGRRDGPAPGFGGDAKFRYFEAPVMNRNGRLTFWGGVSGPGINEYNDQCIWAGLPGQLQVVARTSDVVPPTGLSSWFLDFPTFIAINGADQVAFAATMRWGLAGFPSRAFWVFDPTVGLRVIARAGERLVTGDGVVRTIANLSFSEIVPKDDSSGLGTPLYGNVSPTSAADTGWFVYLATFTDGTQGVMRVALPGPTRCGVADVARRGGLLGFDGLLTPDDLIAFLAAFFGNDLAVADVAGAGGSTGPDGVLGTDDVIAFIAAFFAGCG